MSNDTINHKGYSPYYTFTTRGYDPEENNVEKGQADHDLIRVIPNPYYAYANYEQNALIHRVKIANLPDQCVVTIYSVNGKVPEPLINKVGARIYGLTTPGAKMSKSVPDGCVFLMDSPDDIRRKFKRAVTDSDRENCVRFDKENKPGVANLMNIYSTLTGKTMEQIEAEFAGQGYGTFKPAVGEAVIEAMRPIREEAERLIKDKAYLDEVYRKGAEAASYVAGKTLRKVYKKVGFYQL